jgi:hypothetical protein
VWPTEEAKQAGAVPIAGVVQAIWQSRRATAIVNRVVVPAPLRREFLVRFELGAEWVQEENLVLLRRPSSAELMDSIAGLDPDLSTTLGRSLAAQANAGPPSRNGKGAGEGGAPLANAGSPSRLLISELVSGQSPTKKGKAALHKVPSQDGESLLAPVTKKMFQAVMQEDLVALARLLKGGGDVSARNGQGLTMYDVARDRGKARALKWLEGLGLDEALWEA